MVEFSFKYGELSETGERYKVKPRDDLLNLLDITPATLLEIGCADGTNLLYFQEKLAEKGVRVSKLVGVDAQRIVGCENYSAFSFIHASAEDFIESCPDRFEVIILSDVLEHLYNPWVFVRKLGRLLTDNGRLLLSVPNLQNLNIYAKIFSGEFHYEKTGLLDVTHIRFFTIKTLHSLLADTGYSVVSSGFRFDQSLSGIFDQLTTRLATKNVIDVSVGACTISVDSQKRDLYTAQQILFCARKADRE